MLRTSDGVVAQRRLQLDGRVVLAQPVGAPQLLEVGVAEQQRHLGAALGVAAHRVERLDGGVDACRRRARRAPASSTDPSARSTAPSAGGVRLGACACASSSFLPGVSLGRRRLFDLVVVVVVIVVERAGGARPSPPCRASWRRRLLGAHRRRRPSAPASITGGVGVGVGFVAVGAPPPSAPASSPAPLGRRPRRLARLLGASPWRPPSPTRTRPAPSSRRRRCRRFTFCCDRCESPVHTTTMSATTAAATTSARHRPERRRADRRRERAAATLAGVRRIGDERSSLPPRAPRASPPAPAPSRPPSASARPAPWPSPSGSRARAPASSSAAPAASAASARRPCACARPRAASRRRTASAPSPCDRG